MEHKVGLCNTKLTQLKVGKIIVIIERPDGLIWGFYGGNRVVVVTIRLHRWNRCSFTAYFEASKEINYAYFDCYQNRYVAATLIFHSKKSVVSLAFDLKLTRDSCDSL